MKECSTCREAKENTEFYSQVKKTKDKGEYIYYNPECKLCCKKRAMKWKKDNPEKRKINDKKDNSRPEKRMLMNELNKKNRDRGKYREWQQGNKDKMTEYRMSRANKKHTINKEEWEACKEYFSHECAYCSLHISEHFNKYGNDLKWTDFHKEHVEHEGSNDITNCVPSCKSCNSSKHISKLEDWYTIDNPQYSKDRIDKIYTWLYQDVYNEDIV